MVMYSWPAFKQTGTRAVNQITVLSIYELYFHRLLSDFQCTDKLAQFICITHVNIHRTHIALETQFTSNNSYKRTQSADNGISSHLQYQSFYHININHHCHTKSSIARIAHKFSVKHI